MLSVFKNPINKGRESNGAEVKFNKREGQQAKCRGPMFKLS